MNRPSWDSYFLAIADLVSTRSTCSRAQVGAVLVRDRRIVACGYNGAPAGERHCNHTGSEKSVFKNSYDLCNGHCAIAVHAEANAIADCARRGISCDGCTLYVTKEPCDTCLKLIKSAGVTTIITPEPKL